MSRYIVDISGVGPSQHDFCKRKLIVGKIGKKTPNIGDISPIYRLFTDISPIYRLFTDISPIYRLFTDISDKYQLQM